MLEKLAGLDWFLVAFYMFGMVGIGLYSHRKVKGFEDHILSGRDVPTYYLAPCLLTTQIGAGSIIGFVGLSYAIGYSGGWWIIGNIFTFICLALIGAKPLRRAIKANTLPEWFKLRYDEKCRAFTAVTTLIAEIAFTAGQIVGGGLLCNVVLGWDLSTSIMVFSVVVMIYTVSGGLWAVFLTDFVQMFIMIIGLGALVIVGIKVSGGMEGVRSAVPPEYFQLIRAGELPTVIASVLYSIPAIFCSFDIIQKVMAAKTPQVARNSCFWAAGFVVIFAVLIPMIGILGRVIFGTDYANPEGLTPDLIATILPTGLKGIAIAAVLATLMSSASACLIAASSVLANDLIPKVVKFESYSDRQKKLTSMVVTGIMAILCWALAMFFESSLGSMELAWTALSCGAFIPLMFGLLWKKASSKAAFICMLAGSVTGLVWLFMGNPMGLRPVIPAYIVGILTIIIFSNIFPEEYTAQRAIDSGLTEES